MLVGSPGCLPYPGDSLVPDLRVGGAGWVIQRKLRHVQGHLGDRRNGNGLLTALLLSEMLNPLVGTAVSTTTGVRLNCN